MSSTPNAEAEALASRLITIGEMARRCDVTVRTLRYYEEMDLIGPAKRSEGKYRLYHPNVVKRIQAITSLQALSYSLDDIRSMLGPYTETLGFSKVEHITASKRFLESERACLNDKLQSIQHLLNDIEHRLGKLDSICQSCLDDLPDQNCHDTCEQRPIHIN
jgi:DNA-binding transcriptional MerR regulator